MLHIRGRRTFTLTRPSFAARSRSIRYNHFPRQYSSSAASSPPPSSSISSSIENASKLLPHQGILENFIHHNPLYHLEPLHFKDAIEHVRKLESYMSPGERAFSLVDVDPRKRVNEAMADLCSAFIDRGAAKWAPSFRDKGFLYFFASLENLGFASWRKHARVAANRIMGATPSSTTSTSTVITPASYTSMAETIIEENLDFFGVPDAEREASIRSMLSELRGWAGMFARMETHPSEAPANTNVKLAEFCAVQSILTRSSIEALAHSSFGWRDEHNKGSSSIALWLQNAPNIRTPKQEEIAMHTSAIAFLDQSEERRELLETEFKHTLLHAIGVNTHLQGSDDDGLPRTRPALQIYTCIDDRECSFRRHIEDKSNDLGGVETFGVAGFFGIPIRYEPSDGRGQMILAPEGNNPVEVLLEHERPSNRMKTLFYNLRRRSVAYVKLAWENASFSPIGSLVLSAFAPLSIARLAILGAAPASKQAFEELLERVLPSKPPTDFQLPFAPEQAASLLARTFKDIGTHRRFAPIVFVLGHGAISVNNPFAAAYNCGACGGREGGPNARLLARLANNKDVRVCLEKQHSIVIPEDTIYVGGLHNTTTDTVEFYDIDLIPESHRKQFFDAKHAVDQALGKNALERCSRFLLAKSVKSTSAALRHVRVRSTDAAEVRPELNHATNAAVVVGRRDLTKGHFLDRRVFLPSYDPFSDDDIGTNLEHVLAPALIVCSGINLEYLFSTVAVEHHGAGTKAPLNLVGNVGVLQGTAGDLRPGLPSQMTEMHTPVRALFVVDSPIDRVEAVLRRREQLCNLVRNDWVRLFVRDPTTGRFFRQTNGKYVAIDPLESSPDYVPFDRHRNHGLNVTRREDIIYWTATAGMVLACAVPVWMFGADAMNPRGSLIALCGTVLSLPVLAFSRRYLHGEFMFGRFASLCTGLLLGFNLVATAPTLVHAVAGWSLFGFASTFLIGAYNDRPTVRTNATFAFAAYKISDFAMLVAATFSAHQTQNYALATAGLLLAALFKSSQFPLTSLFVRSMEGPTPASALGYAGLSAHVGVVLLTSTMPLWYDFEWARLVLGAVGLFTTVTTTLVAKIRADRKGALARATSATIGLIFCTLALGYPDLALLMSLGHASFRMIQVLRSPNIIADTQSIRSALGRMPWPKVVPDWLYRVCWRLRRLDTDVHGQFLNALQWISRKLYKPKLKSLTKYQQWLITGAGVVLAGAPFTPFSHYMEEKLVELLSTQPLLATSIMIGHFGVSIFLIRFLLLKVLHPKRFQERKAK